MKFSIFRFLIYDILQVVDSTGGHTVRECEPSSVAGSRFLVSGTNSQSTAVTSVTRTSVGTPAESTLQASSKLLLTKQNTVEPTTTSASTAVPFLKVNYLLVFLKL